MSRQQIESLAGQTAKLKVNQVERTVKFGFDVKLTWIGGGLLREITAQALHPQIVGHLQTKEDFSWVKDAELTLEDGRVFTISFVHPQYFVAHESQVSPFPGHNGSM